MQAPCKPRGEEVRFAPKSVPWGWALQEPSRTQQNPAGGAAPCSGLGPALQITAAKFVPHSTQREAGR